MSDTPDAELLVSGGNDALTELYERHVDDVLRYFVTRTGCGQTAADLTSETFAEALASRHRFRDIGVPGRAWLFKIARRQLNKFLRSEQVSSRARKRAGMQRLILSEDEIDRVEKMIDVGHEKDRLWAEVAALPISQSEALKLRVVEGLSYQEVAARLSCSEGAARVRVSRGLHTIADRLGA